MITPGYCAKFGARWGALLACSYAGLWSFSWLMQADFSTSGQFVGFLALFLLYWVYGCILGSILGSLVGALSGYLIGVLLTKLQWRLKQWGWFVGFFVCAGVWLAMFLLFGWICLRGECSQEEWQFILTFIGYPGIIYVVAGAVLSQHIYHKMHEQRENMRTQR